MLMLLVLRIKIDDDGNGDVSTSSSIVNSVSISDPYCQVYIATTDDTEEYVVEYPSLYRKNVSPKRKILKTIYCHVYRLCCTKWKNGTSIWEMEGCSQ